jgi:hypothetical protein
MKLCFRFLVLLLLSFGFFSCSNELDVLADYEETASVYALLDPNATYQFVKINKVFVNPNSRATDVAKISDSLYFDTLSPALIEMGSGKKIPLIRANIALKDSGIFANSPNYLYVTDETLKATENYRIEFLLPNSKKLISAQTNMVLTPFLTQPVSPLIRAINIPNSSTVPIQFQSRVNSKIFDAFFTFNYIEIDKQDTNKKINKSFEWKILRSYRTLSDKGNEIVIQRTPGLLFYDLMLSKIPVDNTVFRRFTLCEIRLTCGNLELDTYIQATTPSIGIVQKQTEYTNIKNGIGIFASRNTLIYNDVQISENMKTLIVFNDLYKQLNFSK